MRRQPERQRVVACLQGVFSLFLYTDNFIFILHTGTVVLSNATSKLEMHAAVPKAARAATHVRSFPRRDAVFSLFPYTDNFVFVPCKCTIVPRRVHGTTSKREMRAVVPKAGAPPVRVSRLGLAGIGQPSFCLVALRRPFLLNV